MSTLHRLAACSACGRQYDVSATPELATGGAGGTFPCSCGAEVTVPRGRAEDAAVVTCSSCGGPRTGGEERCAFCGSAFTLRELDLDAICPRCMARVSRRGRFCHHCALPLTAPRHGEASGEHRCPACTPAGGDGPPLVSRRVAQGDALHLFECRRCAGMWLDREVFNALLERAKRGRAGVPASPPVPAPGAAGGGDGGAGGQWAYRPCAVCGKLMNRTNYARRSGVILDVCGDHGLWFDHDELRRVLSYVEGGGSTEAEVKATEPKPKVSLGPAYAGGGLDGPWSGRGSGRAIGGAVLEGLAWLLSGLFDR